jgi:hypothetical protein
VPVLLCSGCALVFESGPLDAGSDDPDRDAQPGDADAMDPTACEGVDTPPLFCLSDAFDQPPLSMLWQHLDAASDGVSVEGGQLIMRGLDSRTPIGVNSVASYRFRGSGTLIHVGGREVNPGHTAGVLLHQSWQNGLAMGCAGSQLHLWDIGAEAWNSLAVVDSGCSAPSLTWRITINNFDMARFAYAVEGEWFELGEAALPETGQLSIGLLPGYPATDISGDETFAIDGVSVP